MNTTFFHDTTFIRDGNKYYTCGPMNKEKFYKYKEKFGNMAAVAKVIEVNDENKNMLKEKNLVDNIKVNGVNRNYHNCAKVVKEQMKHCDYAIIRMPSIIGMVACREARKNKVPYLIEMVGCPKDALWYHGGIKYKLLMPFIVIINKFELNKSKYTIYVTEKFLQKRYPTKGKNIACSDVELEDNNAISLKNRIKKINSKKNNEVYKFGIIGSLDVKYKGHKTAIKALSKLKEDINFELHFLGIGNKNKWASMARKYNIEDKVFFDGGLPHEKVYNWIDNIDIYLIPSMAEGLPRALIEAMSRGCPAIGTDIGGIPELLDKEMLIRKNSYNQLARKILELVNDKEKMQETAQRNYDKSLEFKKDKLENRRNIFYNEILKEK